jgi:AraC-like DNA-binding protein
MSSVLVIELLARGIAVGAFLGLASIVLRGGSSPARVTGALFALAAASHTLTQWPGSEIDTALGWFMAPVMALSVSGAGFLWAFGSELFADRAKLDWRRFLPAAGLFAIGLASLFSTQPQAFMFAHKLVSGALIVHALVLVATGWRDDLVESRRRLRGPILILASIYALGVTSVEAAELVVGSARALSPLAAGVLMLLGLTALAAFGQADPTLFGVASPVAPSTVGDADAQQPPEPPTALSAADRVTIAKLEALMRADRPYRDEGMTIAALALRLKVPEHRLRRLINQGLGYRNFSDFLNSWRLAEVEAALADPAQAQVPVATIALDAGFGSLGPFNRAFKAKTGLTPTAFREQALKKAAGPTP